MKEIPLPKAKIGDVIILKIQKEEYKNRQWKVIGGYLQANAWIYELDTPDLKELVVNINEENIHYNLTTKIGY